LSGHLLAFAAAALLHGLVLLFLLTLVRREPPLAAVSQTQSEPLVVRLIALPPDAQAVPGDGSERAHKHALAQEPSRGTRAVRRDRASLPQAPAVTSNTAIEREQQNVDWQADLRSIGENTLSQGAGARRPGWPSARAAEPASETQSDKLGREVSEAARRDCRNAHAHLGLLAIPMLAADAIHPSGCKW
jgi:hypothetical protein